VDFKQKALAQVEQETAEGKAVRRLCRVRDISRATYYRWKRQGAREALPPGPRAPHSHLSVTIRREIECLRHAKRRTWGARPIYDRFDGIVSRHVIREEIDKERRRKNRLERDAVCSYEFVAPDVAWSGDGFHVGEHGKLLRIQDDRSRCTFGFETRKTWEAVDAARFVGAAFVRYGAPYFFKHDLGPEFRSGVFQALLRGEQVIPLPNPPYYPPANGKHERSNGGVRNWLLQAGWGLTLDEQPLDEVTFALLDHDTERRKPVLAGRTPRETYLSEPRVHLDRKVLYQEWSELRVKLMAKQNSWSARMEGGYSMEADRLAALAVLAKWNLVIYTNGSPETPEVLES
jgi:hypothetical protein